MTDKVELSESEKKKEDWMNSKWRPMMGWLYMTVCAFDFVLFPILWSLLQAVTHATQITQWQPLTLQGAGLFHIAMGAVLGIAAMGRTQEKLAGANNGGASTTPPAGFSVPAPTTAPSGGFGGFGSASPSTASPSGFGGASSASSAGFGGFSSPAPVATNASGKKVVPDEQQPLL